jgi:hypothetical protein
VTGLFLALTPSLVTNVLHVGFGAAGGLSIAVLFLANSAGGVWAVRHAAWVATLLCVVFLTLGSGDPAGADNVVHAGESPCGGAHASGAVVLPDQLRTAALEVITAA